MSKFKAIIFDMDGVLIDTEPYYYTRRQTFLNGKGISIAHLSPLVTTWFHWWQYETGLVYDFKKWLW